MDNYSLEEVKMLINENMVTPEIFNNILKSTTRRLELYNDPDDLEILRYLSQNETVPENIKDELHKYLNSYDKYVVKNKKEIKVNASKRFKITVRVLIVIAIIVLLCIFLIINKRWV